MERFQWLTAIIAAHPENKVHGRTRLQKTVKLLQRLGMPTDFGYKLHYYGPYSEDLQAEIGLLENLGFIRESEHQSSTGGPSYTLEADKCSVSFTTNAEFKRYLNFITVMSNEETVILELAATYDMYKELGHNDKDALERLRQKKGEKCNEGREDKALELLGKLGLN
jgi:uncharacterized protein YwgA